MGLYEELFAPDLSLMESTSKLEGLLEYYYAAKDSGEYTTDILYQIKEATEEVSNKKKINALKNKDGDGNSKKCSKSSCQV